MENAMTSFASILTGTDSSRFRLRFPLGQWMRVARERRMLAAMSEQQLRDIGVNAAAAEREASRPFWDLPQGR
jgi:uncharacterized protein YjiS (DUF1127 family)